MKLSFLLTNLNGERALRRTIPRLWEVAGRTLGADFELVCADAGSTDGSVEFLREWAGRSGRVRLMETPCSRGKGREIARRASTGEYVAVFDSDLWVRDSYAIFLRGWLDHPDRKRRGFVAYEDMDGARANLTCSFYPSRLVDQAGGWRDLNAAEDIDLFVRLIRQDALSFVPTVLAEDLDRLTSGGVAEGSVTRTAREQRYARGGALALRWLGQTRARFVVYAYSLPEKMREEWANEPRAWRRVANFAASTLARVAFYWRHPMVYRLTPRWPNGIELHRYLCAHIVKPEEFGLPVDSSELRTNRTIRAFEASPDAPPEFIRFVEELRARNRVRDTGL